MKLWFVEMEAAAAAGLRKCFKEKKNTLEKERYFHLKKKIRKRLVS